MQGIVCGHICIIIRFDVYVFNMHSISIRFMVYAYLSQYIIYDIYAILYIVYQLVLEYTGWTSVSFRKHNQEQINFIPG